MEELKVKVGDKVLHTSWSDRKITTVEKITPTGRIRVSCSTAQFDRFGNKMGNNGLYGDYAKISIPTENDYESIRREQVIHKAYRIIQELSRKKLKYDEAVRILEFFDGGVKNEMS